MQRRSVVKDLLLPVGSVAVPAAALVICLGIKHLEERLWVAAACAVTFLVALFWNCKE
jgi:uncharacterized membrane protein